MTATETSSEEPSSPEPALRLIVGLGNPGERYLGTRHNVGFEVVAELAQRWQLPEPRLECNSFVAEDKGTLLVWPQTFMNRSGFALRCLLERRGLLEKRGEEAAEILVVYDDVNLPLGRLRLRPQGSPGGHRGMESIIENLRTREVPRLRCGVGPEEGSVAGEGLADFVLAPYGDDEHAVATEMVLRAADACEAWLWKGAAEAMNRFNS